MSQATTNQRTLPTSNATMADIIAELQACLDALFSASSGSAQPPTPVRGMWWADTSVTPTMLRIHNGLAWVPVFELDAAGIGYKPLNKAGDTILGPLMTATGTIVTQANMDALGWSTGFPLWRRVLEASGALSHYAYNVNTGTLIGLAMSLTQGGNLTVPGSISKGSGTFLIDHPLDPANRDLAHGFVEAPRYDLIYRGAVKLEGGRAIVDIDAASNMSAGTFAALTTNVSVTSLQNQDGFARLRPGPIEGGGFEIIAEDEACNNTVAWVVIAERNDAFVRSELDANCDSDGRFVPEREKEAAPRTRNAIKAGKGKRLEKRVAAERIGKRGTPRHFAAFGMDAPTITEAVPDTDA